MKTRNNFGNKCNVRRLRHRWITAKHDTNHTLFRMRSRFFRWSLSWWASSLVAVSSSRCSLSYVDRVMEAYKREHGIVVDEDAERAYSD